MASRDAHHEPPGRTAGDRLCVCEHAFGAMDVRHIEAEVNPDNIASNALLRTLGFVHKGRLRQRWVNNKGLAYDTNVYGCLSGDLNHVAELAK